MARGRFEAGDVVFSVLVPWVKFDVREGSLTFCCIGPEAWALFVVPHLPSYIHSPVAQEKT